jgi:hypothetical protein
MPNRSALALAGVAPIDTEAIPTESVKVERSAPPPVTSVTTPPAAWESPDTPFWRRTPVITAAVMAVMLGAFGIYLETKLQTGLQDAAARAEAAEARRDRGAAQAQREIGAAQRAAEGQARRRPAGRAVGTDAGDHHGGRRSQAVRSRREGSRRDGAGPLQPLHGRRAQRQAACPAAPPGATWQLWLVSPGTRDQRRHLTADADRTSAVFEPPANLPRAVIRAMLTLEPAGGSSQPTGSAYALSPLLLVAPPAP